MGRAFFLRADGIFALPSGVAPADGDYGDITVSSSGAVWTIDPGVVTYAKMQNVSATSRVLGRISPGAGVVEELTPTQLTTLINAFSSTLSGAVPLSGGGTTNFLRADGAWAVPAGGAVGANPSASVSLSAVNGVAATFLRSDGAPALDQGIAPTWTGQHKFTYTGGTQLLLGTTTVNSNPSGGSDPAHLVDIVNDVTAYQSIRFSTYGAPASLGGQNNYHFQRARGTVAVPTAVKSGDVFMSMGYRGHNGTGITGSVAAFQAVALEDWTGIANGLKFVLQATALGSVTRRDVLDLNPSAMVYGNSTDTATHTFYGQGRLNRSWRWDNDYQVEWGGSQDCITGNGTTHYVDVYAGNLQSMRWDSTGRVFAQQIHNNSGGAAGTTPMLASGTYTPTLTAVSNSSALVASVCQWMRVGNVVTVSGYFTVTTSGTPATWGVSLPVASNFTAINQCNGSAVSPGSAVYAAIYITADATNDRAQFQAVTGLTTAAVSFTFTYLVL